MVGLTAPTGPVRGLVRSRPWAGPCPSVDAWAQKFRVHGHIADGGGPENAPRTLSVLVSGLSLGQKERAAKPSAQPTLVRTQHLPRYFSRSKPVSPDGGAGFCAPLRAVYGPLAKDFGPAVGQI